MTAKDFIESKGYKLGSNRQLNDQITHWSYFKKVDSEVVCESNENLQIHLSHYLSGNAQDTFELDVYGEFNTRAWSIKAYSIYGLDDLKECLEDIEAKLIQLFKNIPNKNPK